MAAEELAEWNSRRERSARLIQHVWRRWTTGAGSKARSFENSPLARSHTLVEDLAYASDIESNGSSHSFEGMNNEKMSVERKRELIVLVEQRLRAWKAKTPTAENCVEMDALDKKCQQALDNVVGVRNSVRAMKRVLRDSVRSRNI
ncbi:hypothetical protein BSKO_04322 [Bryopsis sp. KO-2023]|nr:hypothetical protein BSKO_04322 [Bryopsis sp. KO-2023]